MIRVFIGWDTREIVAWHVLASSIIERSSMPVSLTPIGSHVLQGDKWWRAKGPFDSTEFSNARFLVPELCGFKGWAIFMDCDMICLADLAELWALRDEEKAVLVRQHEHQPSNALKFLGAKQSAYKRKNWSSLMLLNCGHKSTRKLTLDYVNEAPGLDLHGFRWCKDWEIGEIPAGWNALVRDDGTPAEHNAKLAHFTDGGPWHGYIRGQYAEDWLEGLEAVLGDGNPSADINYRLRSAMGGDSLEVSVKYER